MPKEKQGQGIMSQLIFGVGAWKTGEVGMIEESNIGEWMKMVVYISEMMEGWKCHLCSHRASLIVLLML